MPEIPSSIEDKKIPESKDSIITEVKGKLSSLLAEIGFKKWEKPNKPNPQEPEKPENPNNQNPSGPGNHRTTPEGPGTSQNAIESTPGGNVTPDTGAPGFNANNVAPHIQSTTNTAIEPGQFQPWIDGIAPAPDSGISINTNPNW